ncbi:MAG: aminopeptidase P family protein, partial [Lactobacillaceae bacterium]|nr:aminopeptidase P family protein [Lactobacillaceae bacterium]
MNFERRIENLRKMFDVLEVDAMIVYQGNNNRYLTGFAGGTGEGMLAVSRSHAQFVTDGRYQEEYQNNMPEGVNFVVSRDYYGLTLEVLKTWGVKKVGFEDTIPFVVWDFFDDNLDEKVDLLPLEKPIEILREIKDEDELFNTREAARLSVIAFNQLLEQIHSGMTEKEVADLLDFLAKKAGLEKTSFDTIVASGVNSSKPHATVTDRKLQKGDLVTIDFGYYYNGYTSDITRTFAVGEIDDQLKEIYQVVLNSEKAALAATKADMKLRDLDKVARDVIDEAGFGEYFNHSTGHGTGLDIHEGPAISARSTDESSLRNVLTIEPGIYLPD